MSERALCDARRYKFVCLPAKILGNGCQDGDSPRTPKSVVQIWCHLPSLPLSFA